MTDAKRLPVLTREQLEQADLYGEKLIGTLSQIDPSDLADTIAAHTEKHLAALMDPDDRTVAELRKIAAQLGWWNVLLIIKLREVVRQEIEVIVPSGETF